MSTIGVKRLLHLLGLVVLLSIPGLTFTAPLPGLVLDTGDPLGSDTDPLAVALPAAGAEAVNVRAAHLTFDFTYTNSSSGTVSRLEVYLAIPSDRDNQRITDLTFSQSYSLLSDRYGQPIAYFQINSIPPGQQRTISWQGDVEIEARDYGLDPDQVLGLDQIPADVVAAYTSNESMYRLGSPVIQAAAQQGSGGSTHPYWIALYLHDFVANRLTYVNDGRWDDAETVYLQGHGSCTEYTFLYVALCRARGLPARYVGSSVHRAAGPYVDTLFHRWAEVYLPPYGWVPVDVQADDVDGGPPVYYNFGKISDTRFVTTVGGGGSEYLGWNYHSAYRTYYQDEGLAEEPSALQGSERSFTWDPYPAQLRVNPTSLRGLAEPGNPAASLGHMDVTSQNGPHSWWLVSAPSWASLDYSSGWTPNRVRVLADTTGLSLGVHSGQVVLDSSDNSVAVSLELRVVEEIQRAYVPLALR
jgi:transglutaminase-like putative cysteine protease